MVRLALEVDHWLDRRGRSGEEASGGGVRDEVWEERVHRAAHRFGQYRRLADGVCDVYGCEFLAFLQPNALEGYDFDLYRIDPPEAFTSRADHFREFYRTMRRDTGYIDLSHLFDAWGEDRKALVDELHYTPGFNRFLARHVAERIELAELPVFESVVDEKDAAASPRSLVTRRGWLAPEEDWRLPGDG
jgi:hypothetical protein